MCEILSTNTFILVAFICHLIINIDTQARQSVRDFKQVLYECDSAQPSYYQ